MSKDGCRLGNNDGIQRKHLNRLVPSFDRLYVIYVWHVVKLYNITYT